MGLGKGGYLKSVGGGGARDIHEGNNQKEGCDLGRGGGAKKWEVP